MGCGKSSFGRRLAALSGRGFLDTDVEVEHRAAMTVSEIFAQRGEEFFRRLEEQIVEELMVGNKDTVVALGGGTACRPGVMERLAAAGTTIYLKTTPERLMRRMSPGGRARRPKIAGMSDAELLAYIEKTLPEREKYYNMANFVLDCSAIPEKYVVDVLLHRIEAP